MSSAGVALVAIGLSLAPAVNVWADSGSTDLSLCPSSKPAEKSADYELRIKFEGVIAFVPRGAQGDPRPSLEHPDGRYQDVVALIPRTDKKVTWESAFPVGDAPDFYVPYAPYPLHHPVVRLRARHFAGRLPDICRPPDGGDCDDHWVYLSLAAEDPLRPGWTHDRDPAFMQYDVAVETCAREAPVKLERFANVPLLLKSAPDKDAADTTPPVVAEPCKGCLRFPAAATGSPALKLAARMKLDHGERLMAHEPISEPSANGAPVSFEYAHRSGCKPITPAQCSNCTTRTSLVQCDPEAERAASSPGSFNVARHVVATRRVAVHAALTLTLRRMSDGEVVHRYLLRPPTDGKALEIDVLNLPAEGLFDLPIEPAAPGLAHFNLFYLLADLPDEHGASAERRFYFPKATMSAVQDGRPWCSNARFAAQQ